MTNFDYMRQLLDRIGDLEQKLKEANKRIDREIDVAQRYDEALTEHLRQHGRELTDLFDRLGSVERFLFPNLHAELKDVSRIIGTNDEDGINPLDRRDL
jgi:hypothetical protein